MVGGDIAQDGRSERENHSGPVGKGQKIRVTLIPAIDRFRRRSGGSVDAEGLLAQVKGIGDAGFLVAAASRRDRYHDWAAAIALQITEPLLTCDAVLAKAAFHLRNSALVLAFVSEGLYALH